MKILIIGGFLGSGKTSIILQLAKHIADKYPDNPSAVSIIENEIGEVAIDNKLLGGKGLKVSTLFSGCVCCSLAGEIAVCIREIQENLDPEYVILEATGVAYPSNIKENLDAAGYDSKIICVADAKRWKRYIVPMGMLMSLQLEKAEIILLNKTDIASKEEISDCISSISSYNQTAELIKISASTKIAADIMNEVLK